jgi:hypothetical protein
VGGLICNIEEKGGQAKDGCMNGQQQMGLNHRIPSLTIEVQLSKEVKKS